MALAALRNEIAAQGRRWFLWSPVAFGCGAAVYLALRTEPGWTPLLSLLLLASALTLTAARRGWRTAFLAGLLLTFFAAGLNGAKARTRAVAAPVLSGQVGPSIVEGWVVDVASPGAGGGRLLIAPRRIGRLAPEETPHRVRITVDAADVYGPGAAVRLTAILNPPPGPASPGAYDFARDAYFQRIGGVGFAVKPARLVALEPPADPGLTWTMAVNSFRWSLARRLVDRLGPREGGVAAAMTTGHEAWLTRDLLDAMRDSGLAHILSISGLHMAVVGGFVFFAVRLGLAAWPWLVLRVDAKKVAAVCGLAAVGTYLVISGAPPPAERAAVTAAVAFAAILLDRRAITLRALAIAALVVLAMHPEAVAQPGFQMSFAATTALVALAERWPRAVREINTPWPIAAVQRAAGWAAAAAAVSFVAGLATGPFAIQHFNRMASYGLLANMATAALSSFVIMPALALGAALEAFGLGAPFLAVAGWGTAMMLRLAETVSSWPGAVQVIASAPPAALPTAFLGLLWVCLWDGRLRWLGAPFALAVLLWPRPEPPAAWIADEGGQAAIVQDGRAEFMRPGRQAFASDLWGRRRGLTAAEPAAFQCDRLACASPGASPAISSSATKKPPKPAVWTRLCARADIVLLKSRAAPPPGLCPGALILGPDAFQRGGSAEVWARPEGGWRLVWAQDLRGVRPWTARAAADDGQG
ncbi:MAG: ComEC family competence protein [Pseudomonadota bacterium]|nr:ComEC family competence protein [Pseudomonadota bacterium]